MEANCMLKERKGSATAEKQVPKRVRILKAEVGERQMRRRRRANNELPEESEKRIAKTMMRKNAMTLLEHSTAWAFRWLHSAFYCSYCNDRFVDIIPFKNHVRGKHLNDHPTKKVFAKITENNMVKAEISDLRCRICNCPFDSIDNLKSHLITVHEKCFNTKYGDGILPFKLEQNSFYCQKCFEQFTSFARLNEHMNSHYQNHICDLCGKSFVSISRFRMHAQSHEVGSFECGLCDMVFQTRGSRVSHRMKVHRKGFRYTCPRCSESFTTYFARCKHLVEVHSEATKEYDCDMCGKSFGSSSKRSAHIRTAHRALEKNHQCSHCNWSFVSFSKLRRHLKTHGINSAQDEN